MNLIQGNFLYTNLDDNQVIYLHPGGVSQQVNEFVTPIKLTSIYVFIFNIDTINSLSLIGMNRIFDRMRNVCRVIQNKGVFIFLLAQFSFGLVLYFFNRRKCYGNHFMSIFLIMLRKLTQFYLIQQLNYFDYILIYASKNKRILWGQLPTGQSQEMLNCLLEGVKLFDCN